MIVRIYVETKKSDPMGIKGLDFLADFIKQKSQEYVDYCINGERNKSELKALLKDAAIGDVLAVESTRCLSRLAYADFEILEKNIIKKQLKLVVFDLPSTHILLKDSVEKHTIDTTVSILLDIIGTTARLNKGQRIERIKQGFKRSRYKPNGKTADFKKHKLIEALNASGLPKDEIAKIVKCGVATVYRVLKGDDKNLPF